MEKKLLFMSIVALMASCSKNDVVEINPQDPNIINFTTYVGAATKAGETTTANIADAGVYALSTNKSTFANAFMSNVEIAASNNWAPASPYYWPSTGSVDFFAYSPYAATATISEEGVLTDNSFAIAATADAQVDLLAADAMNDLRKADGAVSINFDHMLSKVDFKVIVKSSKDYSIEINADNFAVVGIDGTHGGMDINDDTRAMVNPSPYTTESGYAYSADAAAQKFETGVIAAAEGGKSQSYELGDNAAFMLLPQTFTAWTPANEGVEAADKTGAAFRMDYNLLLNGEYIVANATSKQTAYFPLPTNIAWEAGKSYLYTLTFDADDLGTGGYEPKPKDPTDPEKPKDPVIEGNEIHFTVTVTPWEDATDVLLPMPKEDKHIE